MGFLREISAETIFTCSKGQYHGLNKNYGLEMLSPLTKVVIVGTITPQITKQNQEKQRFYYFSRQSRNRLYQMLDRYFGVHDFLTLKENNDVQGVLEKAKKLGIAFIDVVDSCNYRDGLPSSNDDDLIDIKLDDDSFEKVKETCPNALLIADSKNALFALLKIAHKTALPNRIRFASIFGSAFKQQIWDGLLSEAGFCPAKNDIAAGLGREVEK